MLCYINIGKIIELRQNYSKSRREAEESKIEALSKNSKLTRSYWRGLNSDWKNLEIERQKHFKLWVSKEIL